jgi:NTP pyrophosphatase (non-canonical NTP hydrolase)
MQGGNYGDYEGIPDPIEPIGDSKIDEKTGVMLDSNVYDGPIEDLYSMIHQCVQDSEVWFPEHSRDLPFLTLAMCGEAGELANQVKKIWRGTHQMDGIDGIRHKIEQEAVDTFIYLANIFGVLEIDPLAVYDEIRAANVERFGKKTDA